MMMLSAGSSFACTTLGLFVLLLVLLLWLLPEIILGLVFVTLIIDPTVFDEPTVVNPVTTVAPAVDTKFVLADC